MTDSPLNIQLCQAFIIFLQCNLRENGALDAQGCPRAAPPDPRPGCAGHGLSLLHQSSLGAAYGVLSGRAIWFKSSLPAMFILSAGAGGISLTPLATLVLSRLQGWEFLRPRVRSTVAR